METDIWGQLALEASSVYLTDGSNVKRSPFYLTVYRAEIFFYKKNRFHCATC